MTAKSNPLAPRDSWHPSSAATGALEAFDLPAGLAENPFRQGKA